MNRCSPAESPISTIVLILFACMALSAGPASARTPAPPVSTVNTTEVAGADSHRSATIDSGQTVSSEGSVTIAGQRIEYRAVAGTILVHPKGWDDTPDRPDEGKDIKEQDANPPAAASMFYAAYFKNGSPSAERPVTFIYNGGPGSSTMWLHMAAFGPKRVVIKDAAHTPAPYKVIDNAYSLLDVSDLVFIDAPGTGFGHIWGKGKEKAFYGLDADAHAFGEFITHFLSQFGRWDSPKYLFGESYGTTRSAVLVNLLQNDDNVDVNGVILLSQILNFDLASKGPQYNPGTDQAYIVALPTYAAVAWYYNRLPGTRPPTLEAFLRQVEQFATTDYAVALQAGSTLDADRHKAIAKQLADFTGLPADYIEKSDLRVDSGQFRKVLLDNEGITIGMCDARFSGPSIDPLSKETDPAVLPDLSATLAAYTAAVNAYTRNVLGFRDGTPYKGLADVDQYWSYDRDQPPNAPTRVFGIANVMPDLATAMKANPDLKIMVGGGYFDFCTAYYQGVYEMHHLPIPTKLQNNIEYHYYPTGHWPYIHEPSLKKLHDDITGFIRQTDNLKR